MSPDLFSSVFPSDVYVERRTRLIERIQHGLILFMGHNESPMNYRDNTYPFRQDASFLYFIGLDNPGLAAVIDADEGREIVFGDDATLDDIVWMGPQPLLSERCHQIGIDETEPSSELESVLQKALKQDRPIHFLPQYRPETIMKIGRLLHVPASRIQERISEALIKAVVAQRSVKSEGEIEQIEAALDVTYEMHTLAMKMSKPGMRECDVSGAMEGAALARGSRLSFPSIFSVHGETLHNHYHGNVMSEGDIAINDSGAESPLHYAGDITRTIPVGGTFTQKQKDIYQIVLDTQLGSIEAMKPGVPYRDVHRLACRILTSGLKAIGLITGDADEAVQASAHTLFFPHGLGHQLGLDVHDMESLGEDYVGYTETIRRNPEFGWNCLRLGRELEPGFAVTVEPGIYFIPALIDRWKADKKCADFIHYDKVETYRDFGGVRLEDDVLITENGCRVLGPAIPKTIGDVEALASSGA